MDNKLFKAQNKPINLKGHIGRIKINSNQAWAHTGYSYGAVNLDQLEFLQGDKSIGTGSLAYRQFYGLITSGTITKIDVQWNFFGGVNHCNYSLVKVSAGTKKAILIALNSVKLLNNKEYWDVWNAVFPQYNPSEGVVGTGNYRYNGTGAVLYFQLNQNIIQWFAVGAKNDLGNVPAIGTIPSILASTESAGINDYGTRVTGTSPSIWKDTCKYRPSTLDKVVFRTQIKELSEGGSTSKYVWKWFPSITGDSFANLHICAQNQDFPWKFNEEEFNSGEYEIYEDNIIYGDDSSVKLGELTGIPTNAETFYHPARYEGGPSPSFVYSE